MSIIERLDDIGAILKEAGADIKPLEELQEYLFYERKDKHGKVICQLLKEGVCLYVLGEDCSGYDELDNCPIKLAGLWWCGENGILVNREQCEDCNSDQDCGCCEEVRSGSAIYNCTVCGRKKVETNHGFICLDPKLTDEEVNKEVRNCNENPGDYFRC